MAKQLDTAAKTAPPEALDKDARMAIAAARRDRADSAAYHAAASNGTNDDGTLSYPEAGSQWDAIGLARLASMALSVAVGSYRTARLDGSQWADCHAALVVAALAKGSAPTGCAADGCKRRADWLTPAPTTDGSGYPTCGAHLPGLTRRVALPAREGVAVGVWEDTAREDADGNLIVSRNLIGTRRAVPAGSASVPLARRLDSQRMPTVGEVNGAYLIERAKGMLADMWAGDAVPTPWDADSEDDREDGSEDADAALWASALCWQDVAPHLDAKTPAERMTLDAALTGLTLSEAATRATVYGYPAPLGHAAARQASSRAAKGMAKRLSEADVRAAVLAALSEAEATEVATGVAAAVLTPATMRNVKTPAWLARLDVAREVNGAALYSAWLARHLWPMRPTLPTPGLAQREVTLTPVILQDAYSASATLALQPCWRSLSADRKRAADARAAKRKRDAERAAQRPTGMAAIAAAWDAADAAAAHAASIGSALADIAKRGDAERAARAAQRDAERLASCPLPTAKTAALPYWTPAERAAYLATLPAPIALDAPTPDSYPASAVLADSAQRTAAAKRRADAEREDAPTLYRHGCRYSEDADPMRGADLPEAWRMTRHAGALTARPLSDAERSADDARYAAHAARVLALPTAERRDWQRRADAQVKRAQRRADRAAKR